MPAYEGGVSVTKAPLTAGSVKRPDWPHLARQATPSIWRATLLEEVESPEHYGHTKDTWLGRCDRQDRQGLPETPSFHDMSWKIAALPSARSQRELLTNDGAIEEFQERRLSHDNCTCTLLIFVVFIETLYNIVLNATLYESYVWQYRPTNKQTNLNLTPTPYEALTHAKLDLDSNL